MSIHVLASLIGIATGLRTFTAPAALSWAVRLGWLRLDGTPFAFFGYAATPYILSLLAVGEWIADKLPQTPNRTAPMGLIGRAVAGAACGGALTASQGMLAPGLAEGLVGAILGAFGGYQFRKRLVHATGGKDLPIAVLEDAIAVGSAFLILSLA